MEISRFIRALQIYLEHSYCTPKFQFFFGGGGVSLTRIYLLCVTIIRLNSQYFTYWTVLNLHEEVGGSIPASYGHFCKVA